jgi:hypothetical protein
VERTTRFTLLLYLPRMSGHGHEARVKNGPALAGPGRGRASHLPSRATCRAPEAVLAALEPPPNARLERSLRGGHSALGKGFERCRA